MHCAPGILISEVDYRVDILINYDWFVIGCDCQLIIKENYDDDDHKIHLKVIVYVYPDRGGSKIFNGGIRSSAVGLREHRDAAWRRGLGRGCPPPQ